MDGIHLAEIFLAGEIEAFIVASIPFAFAIWWFMRVNLLPARQWKPQSGPREGTHFYRKRNVTAQKKPPEARS